MIELGMETNIAMGITLIGMAVYFVKSADLPQELKDRARMNARNGQLNFKREFSFNKVNNNKIENNNILQRNIEEKMAMASKMLEDKMNKARIMQSSQKAAQDINESIKTTTKKIDLVKLNKRIDQITVAITTLEQELKTNNSKNNEIKNQIDIYLNELERLNSKRLA